MPRAVASSLPRPGGGRANPSQPATRILASAAAIPPKAREQTRMRRPGSSSGSQQSARTPAKTDDDSTDESGADPKPGKRPQRRSRKKGRRNGPAPRAQTALLLGLLAVLFIGGYGAYWVLLANMLYTGIDTWVAQQKAQGISVSYRSARVAGFPGVVSATLKGVTAQADVAAGGWTWQTEQASVEISPFSPTALTIDVGGAPHSIRVPGGSTVVTLIASAETGRLRLDSSRGQLRAIDLILEGARLGSNVLGDDAYSLESLTFAYEALKGGSAFEAAPSRDMSHRATATLAGLTAPAAAPMPVGQTIQAARVDLRVLGPLTFDGPMDTALATWRDADGVVMVDSLTVDWPPLSLDAIGRVALDRTLQPDASLKARVKGFVPLVEALHQRRVMRGSDATMAKVLLSSLARPDPDGEPVLDMAMTIRDETLWLGPVALMPVPRLPWGPPRGSLGEAGITPGFTLDRQGNPVAD